nr:DNA polymerase [Gelria sp. Kuro-4]
MLARGKDIRPDGAQCDKCTLQDYPCVGGCGPAQADIVICGEAPGPTEAARGVPFVGRAGKLLDTVLKEVGIDRDECYLTNACLCAPEPIRPPKPKELKACLPRLWREVLAHRPKVVIALGNTALKALAGKHGISNWHGALLSPDLPEAVDTTIVPAYHPAAVLRSPRLYQDLKTDLEKALLVLQGKLEPPKESSSDVKTVVIDNVEDARELIDRLWQLYHGQEVALDVETSSTGELLCIGLSWKPGTAVVVTKNALQNNYIRDKLDVALGRLTIVGHNLKYDLQVLWRHGIPSPCTGADTMLEHYLLNNLPGTHGLKQLAKDYLNMPEYDAELKPYHKTGFENCPPETLYRYNAKDASYTLQLHRLFQERLSENDHRVLETLLYPASDVLARMESLGVLVDIPLLRNMDIEYATAVDDLLHQLHQHAGHEFNPNSHKQLLEVLYKELELPIPGRLSSDKDALEELKGYHPIVDVLLEYRTKKKLHSTYVKALLEAADINGRVHTTFNLHGTVTGRLSSSNPVNLQNIPKDSDIRKIFIATPGYTLVEGDLSQAEVRGLAYYSQDENLIQAIRAGGDMHIRTACLMFKVKPEEVTKEMRQKAKHLTFGVIYQMSAPSLAAELGISVSEAEDLIEEYFKAFPQAQEWIEETKRKVLEVGKVSTPFGRTRNFGFIGNDNRNEVLRQAVNAPIQSLASDVTLTALIKAGRCLVGNPNTRLLLTVHDSILLETKEDPVEVARWLQGIMSAPVLDGSVPFDAEVKIGPSWGELKTIEEYLSAKAA